MSAKTCEGCPALVRDKDNQESCIYTRPFTYCPKMKPDYSRFLALAEKWRKEVLDYPDDMIGNFCKVSVTVCSNELEALVKEMQSR